ncbi:GNAT family N-acetyltransferase [Phototrophicus methaneseepsis]|uniref:GNAT family N-acetyltransferase n=1 Tax=Phototrophicus methaneseepsis TaxID=2710758 RepID=A0A7S8IGT2_9CHLR|nr:GNAT family N-acetyltransferase [Phototrophicus methaneseepsis]QPC85032.1 GNAT family N-acetyltransferase [Phototrophicus methaneseepsis]
MRIAVATEQDIPAIREVLHASWLAANEAIYSAAYIERFLKRTFTEKGLTHAVNNQGAVYLVAFAEDRLVGVCHFGAPLFDDCETRKELYYIYVHPDYWGQGVGTALLDELGHYLRPQRKTEVFTYLNPQSDAALDFFIHRGFVHLPSEDKDGESYLRRVL